MVAEDTFAFIIHPIDPKKDVARKFPLLGKYLTERQIDFFSTFFPPVYISRITGIRSQATGKELHGWFIACPYTPRRMLELPVETVYRKIVAAGRMAERLGARILGLGAFTSVVGDAGITVAERLDIPVTNGDSYTVAVTVEALYRAGRMMGVEPQRATAAVVGATGAIGSISARMMARDVGRLILIARRRDALGRVRELCEGLHAQVEVSTEVADIRRADLVLSATSSLRGIIGPDMLKVGAVVCDVSRPRDVSPEVARARDDVLVIDGGVVEVPGDVDFHFDFGFPPKMTYACMAETMALALEGRYEDYTLGKGIEPWRVEEIARIAARHGFRLAGFRSFDRDLTEEQIARTRENADRRRSG